MCQEALECLDMRVCVHVCHVHMYHVCDICDGHVSNEKQSALNYLYGESIPTRLGKGFGLLLENAHLMRVPVCRRDTDHQAFVLQHPFDSPSVHLVCWWSILESEHVTWIRCYAVCCSVLQCVAMCCSGWQWVAVCCSVLQCVAVGCSGLQCAVCCSKSEHVSWISLSSSTHVSICQRFGV